MVREEEREEEEEGREEEEEEGEQDFEGGDGDIRYTLGDEGPGGGQVLWNY